MPASAARRPCPALPAIVAAALGLAPLGGCSPKDEVRTYQVPKTPSAGPAEPTPEGPAKVRLLGAVIPVGGQSWFVKLVGPAENVDPHEKDFDAFLASIRVGDDLKKPITWIVPIGWREAPPRQMRQATFVLGPEGKTVECYVSTPFGGNLLDNVNRWREGDAGLPKVTEADLPAVTQEVPLGGAKAYRVDFRGPGGKGGMMRPPFAGRS